MGIKLTSKGAMLLITSDIANRFKIVSFSSQTKQKIIVIFLRALWNRQMFASSIKTREKAIEIPMEKRGETYKVQSTGNI